MNGWMWCEINEWMNVYLYDDDDDDDDDDDVVVVILSIYSIYEKTFA